MFDLKITLAALVGFIAISVTLIGPDKIRKLIFKIRDCVLELHLWRRALSLVGYLSVEVATDVIGCYCLLWGTICEQQDHSVTIKFDTPVEMPITPMRIMYLGRWRKWHESKSTHDHKLNTVSITGQLK